MSYRGSRILITGGLGFIGSNVARQLVAEGAEVELFDNLNPSYGGNRWNIADFEDRVAVTVGDVRDASALRQAIIGKDFIFNLAAQTSHVGSMQEPLTDLQINATAQLQLVEACRRDNPNVKIIYGSTRQLYGKPRYLPVDESHPIRPVDVNGISKFAGEHFHLLYSDVYGIRSIVLRLTNTFGPGMRVKDARQTFIGIWIRRLLEGDAIPIFGDGKQLRDFTYVEDCVAALLVAGLSDAANGKVFNIGGDQFVSLLDVARMMTEIVAGGRLELQPFPAERKAIDIGDYYSDFKLFQNVCGWSPKTELRVGLQKTVDFYRSHMQRYL